ncbi:MAG: PilZ domain-containing protein [Nitrospirota bacterium]|nr:PilZ domain-containing protein [Nitrospirota bacterium]
MPDPQPSARDRRNYFRITIVLPVSIQLETDTAEGVLTEKSVNLSAGGIGFVSDLAHQPGEILAITLLLQEQVLFKAQAEVLSQDPLPSGVHTYRIHARFIRMSEHDRELLIGHIMRLQRANLHEHYSA